MNTPRIHASLAVIVTIVGMIFSSAIELNAQSKQSSSQSFKKSGAKKSGAKKPSGGSSSGGSSSGGSSSGGSTSAPTPEMVTVEGGTLPSSSGLADQTVSTFEIGKYEVTWAEWQEVRTWGVNNGYSDLQLVGSGASGSHPVIEVSWFDAVKWCNAKSEMEGLVPVYEVSGGATYKIGETAPAVNSRANGYRLPKEAEWEWAARGGASSQGYTYSGSNDINSVAWYHENSGGSAHIVGTKAANELGIHDMTGNVWEWCEDAHSNPGLGYRQQRGGGWGTISDFRIIYRYSADPDLRYERGFRVARNTNYVGMVTVLGGTLPSGSELAGQTVSTFEIGKYEVTWGEWKEVRDWAVNNGYTDLTGVGGTYRDDYTIWVDDTYPNISSDNFPVGQVSWYDVCKWCNARSEKDGLTPVYQVNGVNYKTGEGDTTMNDAANGYRLPKEAEWEWAARGGASSQGYTYSGSNDINSVAWYEGNRNSGGTDRSAGTKAANELGIHDMSGNVFEWTWETTPTDTRRFRGGSSGNAATAATVAFRDGGYRPYDGAPLLGFRLARNSAQ